MKKNSKKKLENFGEVAIWKPKYHQHSTSKKHQLGIIEHNKEMPINIRGQKGT
jgi:hypothetical protein